MTPEEKKAKELVETFAKANATYINDLVYKNAKQNALICVDEISKYEDSMIELLDINPHDKGWLALMDWNEVKKEIDKL